MIQSMFSQLNAQATEIIICTPETLPRIADKLGDFAGAWLKSSQFEAAAESVALIPNQSGELSCVLWGKGETVWQMAALAAKLPAGNYVINDWGDLNPQLGCLTWTMAQYQFDRYKKSKNREWPKLIVPESVSLAWVNSAAQSITLIRDLINTPAADMLPHNLADVTRDLAQQHGATVQIVSGERLQQEFPSVYTVGKAALAEPLLIDLRWSHPLAKRKLVLVGKGVCFDSGGLDIKPASGMLTMKKDMGGAAHVLGLASLIMEMNLPLDLRMIIPAVENAISGNAMRPLDVIKTRKGTTVEIGNTDAEGRLILADALFAAAELDPDLIIDFATLTGAARLALGTELPALFSNRDSLAEGLLHSGSKVEDPLWRMPLHQPYKRFLKSNIADLNNIGKSSYGGAITAALFLEHFVGESNPWVHIDLMAWNLSSSSGRPEGGEAMGLLAVYDYLVSWLN